VVDTHGLATTYSYDAQGRLSQVQATDGGATALTYDPTSGLLSTITEPGGRVVQLRHDGGGNLTLIADVDGTTRAFGYDTAHHLTGDQWAPLNATFSYDPSSGLLTGVNRGLGTSYAVAATAAQGLGAVSSGPAWASLSDALNHTRRYRLDRRGRLLVQVLPDGSTSSYQRDAAGQVTLALDPLHRATRYTYAYGPYNSALGGGDGDLVRVGYADGSFSAYRYDATFHHRTQASNALGVTQTNTYDVTTGDLMTSADALGNTTTYAWAVGLLQSVTDPRGATSAYAYDADRRQTAAYDALHVPTVTAYDANGNVAATTDAYGHVTQTLYSPRGLLLQTTDALGGVTSDT
jgi:YD repeat-containing protein